jgi:glycine cleavage system regulatory protein
MRVVNHANLSPEQIAQLEAELSRQQNLNDVMKWALAHPKGVFIPSVVVNVIVQDEFTHDVIIPYRGELVLVYDRT